MELPNPENETSEDSLWAEHSLLLEEYNNLNAQIPIRIQAQARSYELTVITLSAAVAASSIIISPKAYSLLLVLGLPFYILIWQQTSSIMAAYSMKTYIWNWKVVRASSRSALAGCSAVAVALTTCTVWASS